MMTTRAVFIAGLMLVVVSFFGMLNLWLVASLRPKIIFDGKTAPYPTAPSYPRSAEASWTLEQKFMKQGGWSDYDIALEVYKRDNGWDGRDWLRLGTFTLTAGAGLMAFGWPRRASTQ